MTLQHATERLARCPDCDWASLGDPPEAHSYHCIGGLGPTCSTCFACRCGRPPCINPCACEPHEPAVYGFDGPYAFLSNFAPSPIVVEGMTFATVEHAFQALKSLDPADRVVVQQQTTPGRAKRAGRRLRLRSDWERVKDDVMLTCVRAKFRDAKLGALLLQTGTRDLVEANDWGDRCWGVDRATGIGENRLGRALVRVRDELRCQHERTANA